jgi:hypothetical protein
MKNFVLVLVALMCSSATMALAQDGKKLAGVTEDNLKKLIISFERTSCYGNCPAYKLTIKGDGTVTYEGIRDVKTVGKNSGTLTEGDLRAILKALDDANFLTIGDTVGQKCTCGECTDMPSAKISVTGAGLDHTVDHYHGCRCATKSLWEAEDAIDKILKTEQWTGDVSKAGPRGTTCSGPSN